MSMPVPGPLRSNPPGNGKADSSARASALPARRCAVPHDRAPGRGAALDPGCPNQADQKPDVAEVLDVAH